MATGHKKYSNGEITVLWQPEKCYHAAECIKGAPEVFNVNRRPWIDINAAPTDKIAAVVERCPSGALTYTYDKK